jgi:hypothetical protein
VAEAEYYFVSLPNTKHISFQLTEFIIQKADSSEYSLCNELIRYWGQHYRFYFPADDMGKPWLSRLKQKKNKLNKNLRKNC